MKRNPVCLDQLQAAGISQDDAAAFRRIAMTLHRWHELECGDGNDYASWCITRGHKNGGEFLYSDHGLPYLERHNHNENKARYERIPDRERGAQDRLAKIMARYPDYVAYVQGDPRGAALYIVHKSVNDVEANYNRGIAVYR
jgi:hypothetical protein